MKVELFTLCDGAYNYGGRLTIVGTLDTVSGGSMPFRKPLAMAVKLTRDDDERDARELSIAITDGEQIPVIPDMRINIPATDDKQKTKIVIALNLSNVLFRTPGTYTVTMKDNGKTFYHYEFSVCQ